jgi:hypothetical protein
MKRRLTILALTALAVVALIGVDFTVTSPAIAGGATQISGIGFFDEEGDCTDFPNDTGPGEFYEFALNMTGDLDGCLYVHIKTGECSPSGTYRERGTEFFVGRDSEGADEGADTFETTYLFTAKLGECPDLATEIWGRCQHPIVAGSGTGVFEGVTGRFDIKDDIVEGNFPYRGHLRW